MQAPHFSSVQDIEIQFEVLNTGADESMRAFVNASTVPSWDSGWTQVLGQSSGTMKFMEPYPFAVYDYTEDLRLDWNLDGKSPAAVSLTPTRSPATPAVPNGHLESSTANGNGSRYQLAVVAAGPTRTS